MKKSDLRDGMYLKIDDGTIHLLFNDMLVYQNGWLGILSNYNDDLTNVKYEDWDIIKVGVRKRKNYGIFDEQAIDWIWTRPTLKYKVGDLFVNNVNGLKYKIVKVLDNKYEMGVSYVNKNDFTPSCVCWTDEKIDKRMTPYEEPIIKEVTMEELEKDYGCKVKIIK